MLLRKKLILKSYFKTISIEKFTLWEIAARKLDSSPVGIERSLLLVNNKGTDQTAMMSKPAYLSVEIVTDKSTSGKISIPQLVSVVEQTGLSLTWSQTHYLCQHACVSTHAE